ncbi:N(6)-adenine-specific methyltransferase METTL4 isoform X2 [Melanotaenia boesemani]|uniref:N(6)-adenine-specific methyltransferase METTL4 isoform X2 n=1 Tax=Melanotaenia boesemani TaxID=1250792 RepID=UPI001C04672A|nr:N(6)-adenine-specific methyltransferase METTL4 isoform X2 [Melanotaenia boesemani]
MRFVFGIVSKGSLLFQHLDTAKEGLSHSVRSQLVWLHAIPPSLKKGTMSVVVQSSLGYVVDARSLIDQSYVRCTRFTETEKSHVKCSFKKQCFQIFKSHYSHGASADMDEENTNMLQKTDKSSKKRKRKRSQLNQGEIDSQAFHEKIRSIVLEGTKALVDSAQTFGYLNGETDTMKEPLPSKVCSLAALCEMAKELPLVDVQEQEESSQLLVTQDGFSSHVDLFSRVTENKEDWAAAVTLMGEEYVIPPHTAFLLSDFTRIQPLISYGRRFNLIVMDPPWENKSVKRSRRYSSLPSSQLKRLPVPLLASPNCLVVTWVTNRPSHLRFVRDELYPHWGVQVVAEWFWVKVTTSGEFVFPLDSQHKKPYETLVLGRYRSSANISISTSEIPEVPIEDKRLIISVPSALHSQKPSLSEVLKPYVGAEAKCLELFARNLQPGWTSWGNEVLKYQHTSYFTVTPADDQANASKDDCTDKSDLTQGFSSPGKTCPPHHCASTMN